MSVESKLRRSLGLSIAVLCLSSLAGCQSPSVCIRPVLQLEPPPALHRVDLYPPGSPQAEYCLTDRGRRDVLEDLEMYRAALESSRKMIQLYNDSIEEDK